MELFDKNGCLTDEGLQALQAGGLDELGRLESAEHLSYCDKCMDRYTALLTADALETPPHSAHKAVMAAIWVRLMQNTWGRAAVAGVAAVLAFTMWRSGTIDQLLNFRQELHTWTPETSQSQTEEALQLGKPVEDDRPSAQPEILGKPMDDDKRSSRLRWQKHSMTCCSEPAALQQKNTKIRHLQIKRNKEIDYDEKRNPDLPLRLLPGRRPDVSGLHEARPFAHYHVLRGLWCGHSAGSFVCSHAHCVDVQLL